MNWAQENKFLTGFIAVMVLAVGFLGYKVFSAQSAFDEATDRYTSKAAEYSRLRHLAPYPNRQNLEQFEKQKAEAAQTINTFQADLAKKEFPVLDLKPTDFQDELKNAVTAVRTKAAEANVQLPAKFYLGFDRYETQPPPQEATPKLGRQLKAIEWVVNQAISIRVTEIRSLVRPELSEEKGAGSAGAGRRNERQGPGGGAGARGGQGGRQLVTSQSFDLVVICKQDKAANLLSTIISPKAPQFFIPRAVRLMNQTLQGPPREAPAPVVAIAPPTPDGATAPAAAAVPAANVNYIVGQESVELAMSLEIVDFAEPAAKPEPAEK